MTVIDSETEDKCQFYVAKRKRLCRLTRSKGSIYCGEHLIHDPELSKERVPCPLNPDHSIFAKDVKKHVHVCNYRRFMEKPECYMEDINGSYDPDARVRLADLDPDAIKELIRRVNVAYRQLEDAKMTSIKTFDRMQEFSCDNEKHMAQIKSLIEILNQRNLIDGSDFIIEFGAGRGKLTRFVHEAANNSRRTWVFVDRSNMKRKCDVKIGLDENADVVRLRLDIKDLALSKCSQFQHASNVLCLGKHLCGAATDLTLRCITDSLETDKDRRRIAGIGIALCCHQRLAFECLNNVSFYERLGLSETDIRYMALMSTWATCGQTRRGEHVADEEVNPYHGLNVPERRQLGLKCKRIIDFGRLDFLKQHGFDANLLYYTTEETTPENVMLIASRCRSQDQNTMTE